MGDDDEDIPDYEDAEPGGPVEARAQADAALIGAAGSRGRDHEG